MRKILPLLFFFISGLLFFPTTEAAAIPALNPTGPVAPAMQKLASLSIKDAQKLAGRKFTLKEKLSFWLLKGQLKKAGKKGFEKTFLYKKLYKRPGKAEDPKTTGQSALVFGIASIALLLLGLFIPYVIMISPIAAILAIVLGSIAKKKDPSDQKGRIGKLLGWISLGLFAVLIIAVVIALSTWAWG